MQTTHSKPTINRIYLASKSPRRRELLNQLGVDYDVLLLRDSANRPVDVSEEVLNDEKPIDYVTRVTREKAQAGWRIVGQRQLPLCPVLAADTTVVLNGIIYGKPVDKIQAIAMIEQLSGQTHQVLTSVAIHFNEQCWQITQQSEVTFCALNSAQIDHYCNNLEPYDKAGGYGIQGKAAQFISHISGSYSGIMGLPLYETAQLLTQAGITLL